MAFSGEEKGLLGSEYFSDHPTYPLDHMTADLNIDMIGRIDPNRKQGDSTNYVYVVGSDKLSTDLKPISEGNNKKYSKLELDYKFDDPTAPERIYYRSDHYNFARKGVPIISSRRRICWLIVGCAINIRSAACVNVPASATATK